MVLAEQFPERQSARNYYIDLSFQIFVADPAGEEHFLVDGGFTEWTQRLMANRKECFLSSGIGTERLCAIFAP